MKLKAIVAGLIFATLPLCILAQAGPYKVLATTKVGGEGGYDYVTADSTGRRLYVARSGAAGHVTVFDLDTLKQVGDLPNINAHGAVVDVKTGHGFTASKPVVMFDAKTLAVIKTVNAQGNPDGSLNDAVNSRVYILSHSAPNVTVIDAKDGTITGTIDLGGEPEQAVLDGAGHMYIDLEDKDAVAVVDVTTMKMTGRYDISSQGGGCAGLAIDVKNGILFAACRDKSNMIILNAKDGKILTSLPTGKGCDGAVFNPATMEVFSTQGDGTLTIIKETSPTTFVVEQTVTTPVRARTLTLDTKTGNLYSITGEFGPAPAAVPGQRPGRAPMLPGSFEIVTVGK